MEVAILLATYNSGDYLRDLLDSLLNQSFKDFVCYVHDDGSNDGTKEILQYYASNTQLKLNILDYPATGSAKGNFMSLLKYVEEPYVMFCDHDDVWLENKIEKSLSRIKSIETDGLPALVFSDLYVVDQHLDIINESFMTYSGINPKRYRINDLLLENVAPGCTMIANRALYLLASQLQNIQDIRMHDHWFMLVAAGTGTISFLNEPLILYRQHDDNEVGAVKNIGTISRIKIVTTRIIAGEYREGFIDWLVMMQKQAKAVARIEEVKPQYRKICLEFADINKYNKSHRIAFYCKNKIKRRAYNLWFLICC